MCDVGELGADPRMVNTDLFPRDPTAYGITNHFRDRVDNDERIATLENAARAIAHGDITTGRDGAWKFLLDDGGLTLVIVCVLGDELSPAVMTGYANVEDPVAAITEHGHPRRAVKVELFRNRINSHQNLGGPLKQMSFSPAHEVDGHRIITEAGSPTVKCVDCGTRFSKKYHLGSTDCS